MSSSDESKRSKVHVSTGLIRAISHLKPQKAKRGGNGGGGGVGDEEAVEERQAYLHRDQLHRKNHPDRPSHWEKQIIQEQGRKGRE